MPKRLSKLIEALQTMFFHCLYITMLLTLMAIAYYPTLALMVVMLAATIIFGMLWLAARVIHNSGGGYDNL